MKKSFILLAVIVVAVLGLYWLKCQEGIDLFPGQHLGSYLPVAWLNAKDTVIHRSEYSRAESQVWQDNFETRTFFSRWGRLWSEKKSDLRCFYGEDTQRKNHWLAIENQAGVNWSLRPRTIVQVQEGDRFRVSGLTRAGQGSPEILLAIVLFDAQKNVLNWSLVKIKSSVGADWTPASQDFVIPKNGAYIQIRLTGQKMGTSLFDNLELVFLGHA